ncbi:DUF2147 domain-containing protein [Sphingomonas sp.]|uniref:DUF2147 domain-containing protein n=1 Tax=Sphingomonas sp. TaxID=28214 RepID=UPI003B007129
MIGAALLLAAAPVAGHWLTAEGKAVVEIARCGPAMCGRIVRVLKPRPGGPAIDINNPVVAHRNRPMEGLTILTGLQPGADRWRGQVYDPESGRTYRAELSRAGRNLTVKGCWGPFCRSQAWTAIAR